MNDVIASPYINFQGHAREALEFYQKVLGGELTLTTEDRQGPPKAAGPNDHIMHGMLTAGNIVIMGTDGLPQYPPTVGDNIAIVLSGTDREHITRVFDQLSEGGMVKQALKEESWGDLFGYFKDKFGVNWMVNINSKH